MMIEQPCELSVMQFVLNLKRAGAQEVVRTLTEYLPKEGCTVTVCSFQDGPLRADIEKLGVKVEILRRPRYSIILLPMFLMDMLRIRRDLARLIETYQVDIAQTHILQVLDFLILSLRGNTRLQVVLWTMQNIDFLPKHKELLLKPKQIVYRLLYRLLSGKVDGFIAVSNEVKRSIIRQVGPVQDKIYTICNAVNLVPFQRPGNKTGLCKQLGLEPHSRLIVTVGRLTRQKGHCYLIEAAKDIVSVCPEAHFLFVGEGELKESLQQQARQLVLTEHIHFLGVRSDVPDLLAAADLFVLPSLWEGLSVALLEGMAAGKPIVATAVSGTTQAMVDDKTGLVVPPGDSRALSEAILQLLTDKARADSLGEAAREYVAVNFSAQKQAAEHMALYRRLLNRWQNDKEKLYAGVGRSN